MMSKIMYAANSIKVYYNPNATKGFVDMDPEQQLACERSTSS